MSTLKGELRQFTAYDLMCAGCVVGLVLLCSIFLAGVALYFITRFF